MLCFAVKRVLDVYEVEMVSCIVSSVSSRIQKAVSKKLLNTETAGVDADSKAGLFDVISC